jgi:hypothetical protein
LLLSFVYFLTGWYIGAVSLLPGDVILAQPACPLIGVISVYTRE